MRVIRIESGGGFDSESGWSTSKRWWVDEDGKVVKRCWNPFRQTLVGFTMTPREYNMVQVGSRLRIKT